LLSWSMSQVWVPALNSFLLKLMIWGIPMVFCPWIQWVCNTRNAMMG